MWTCTLSHINTYTLTQKLEVHNSGPAEITEELVKSGSQSRPPSLEIKFQ